MKKKKWEVVHVQPWDGKERVIHKNLTEAEANEYFYGIDNTYIREMIDSKVQGMHREIEHYLSVHTFDSDTRYGIVNEGKNLLKYLENHKEEELFEEIEIYRIYASNGNVSICKKETRTFLNVGKFSFYYHGDCYESTIFDRNGKPTGGNHWITERSLNKPSLHLYNGKASGELYILASVSEERKKNIVESAKRETLYKCREKFGRW